MNEIIIRTIENKDVDQISYFEKEISEISFEEDAITDIEFHRKKLINAMTKEKEGMLVLCKNSDIIGWLWMTPKKNSITEEKYINFKSFYIVEKYRGKEMTDLLMKKGIEFAKSKYAKYIVGKVNIKNLPMRTVYKEFGFNPTHISMELKIKDE